MEKFRQKIKQNKAGPGPRGKPRPRVQRPMVVAVSTKIGHVHRLGAKCRWDTRAHVELVRARMKIKGKHRWVLCPKCFPNVYSWIMYLSAKGISQDGKRKSHSIQFKKRRG